MQRNASIISISTPNNSMKIFHAIALTGISIYSLMILVSPLQAQTPVTNPSPVAPTPPSNDWKDYSKTEAAFMQGCLGKLLATETAEQKQTKQKFCQCAFNSYKARYTPIVFTQINGLANKIGKDGVTLVNVMMSPDLKSCSTQTGFRP